MKYYTTRIATKQGPRYQIAEKIDPNGPCSWENLESASPRLFRTIEECDAAVDEMNAKEAEKQAAFEEFPYLREIEERLDAEDKRRAEKKRRKAAAAEQHDPMDESDMMVFNPFIPKYVLPDPVSFQLSLCDELDAILAN